MQVLSLIENQKALDILIVFEYYKNILRRGDFMMQMKDRTKIMFADTLEEMLKEMPLDKVRVAQLCQRCGATTPTFYYYFHDKYELVAWMFLQDFAGEFGDQEPEYSPGKLNQSAIRMAKRRNFYQKAFDDHSQNSITNYMIHFNMEITRGAVRHLTGQDLTKGQEFAVKFHIYGVMGMFQEWLFGEDMTSEYLNQEFYERTPTFMKDAFSVYPYSTESILQYAGKRTKKK